MNIRKEGSAMLRYLSAGATGVVVGLALGYVLNSHGVSYPIAAGAGYVAGFCANYSTARLIVKVVRV